MGSPHRITSGQERRELNPCHLCPRRKPPCHASDGGALISQCLCQISSSVRSAVAQGPLTVSARCAAPIVGAVSSPSAKIVAAREARHSFHLLDSTTP